VRSRRSAAPRTKEEDFPSLIRFYHPKRASAGLDPPAGRPPLAQVDHMNAPSPSPQPLHSPQMQPQLGQTQVPQLSLRGGRWGGPAGTGWVSVASPAAVVAGTRLRRGRQGLGQAPPEAGLP